jgi:acyl carrier protein
MEIKGDTFSLKSISEESYIHALGLDSMEMVEIFFLIEIPLTITINEDTTINKFINDINELGS